MKRGAIGEEIAAGELERKGFRIIARNFRTRQGEIDLIAEDARYLVFAEVKLRKNDRYGAAREFVTPAKQKKLILAAEEWLQQNETALQPRFDVIEIYMPMDSEEPETINHLVNAFEA